MHRNLDGVNFYSTYGILGSGYTFIFYSLILCIQEYMLVQILVLYIMYLQRYRHIIHSRVWFPKEFHLPIFKKNYHMYI